MKKKLLIALLLIVIVTMTLVCFAGCGDNKEEDNEPKVTITLLGKDGSEISSLKVNKDSIIEAPDVPKLKGFVFEGWYSDSKLEKAFNFKETKITDDMTLYSKWKEDDTMGEKMILGLQVSAIGIGMVFVILGVLIGAVSLTKYILGGMEKSKAKKQLQVAQDSAVIGIIGGADGEISPEIIAVITGAITCALSQESNLPQAEFVVKSIKKVK